MKNCLFCNEPFNPKNKWHHCCSPECAQKQYLSKKVQEKECEHCHNIFLTPYKDRKFCSLICAHDFNREHKKNGGDFCSQESYISRYGIEEGIRKFKALSALRSALSKKINHPSYKHSKDSKEQISNSVKKSAYHNLIRGKLFEDIYGAGARKRLSEKMKGFFSKEWFINRYGAEKGLILYLERSQKTSEKSFFKIYNKSNKNNYSKISQKLFWKIYEKLEHEDKIYFAELNHEYSCGISRHNFDFVNETKKKVIEFYGDKFHANPTVFKKEDLPSPYSSKTAKEIWEQDKNLRESLKKKGYKVLVVWEKDYRDNTDTITVECINFIMGG
jgi:very-short-patch-repair endonuclease